MTPARKRPAAKFAELRFRPERTWALKGIAERGCWIRASDLETLLEAGGKFTVPQLADCLVDWLAFTDDAASAKRTLHRLLHRHFLIRTLAFTRGMVHRRRGACSSALHSSD